MAIIVGNKTINLAGLVEEAAAATPKVVAAPIPAPSAQVTSRQPSNIVVEPTTEEQRTLKRKFVVERNALRGVASDEASLLVNGKQKSIGRKSKYLLDMLTLDD